MVVPRIQRQVRLLKRVQPRPERKLVIAHGWTHTGSMHVLHAGRIKPQAFLPYRINGQYIMEGLCGGFFYTLGGKLAAWGRLLGLTACVSCRVMCIAMALRKLLLC